MLTSIQLKTIKKILFSKLDPHMYSAFIFGSRATNTNEEYSDIDIGIEGQPIPSKTKIELQDEFEESYLPYRVDIVDFSTVTDTFKHIAKQKVVYI